jgi:hypothetical protein
VGVCDHQPVTRPAGAALVDPAPVEVSPRAHHLPAAVLAALATALMIWLPEVLGEEGRLAAVLLLQLGLVGSWVLVTGIQGFSGSIAVGAAGAAAADLLLVLPQRPSVGGLLAVLGVAFLAIVVQQMLRRPRTELVASLSGAVLMVGGVCGLAVFLLVDASLTGPRPPLAAVLAAGGALVVGHLVDTVYPRPQLTPEVPRGLLALALAVTAGAAAGFLARSGIGMSGTVLPVLSGAAIGGVAALVGLAASYIVVEAVRGDDLRGADDAPPALRRWALPVLQVAAPLAACGPVAFALLLAL